MTLSSGYTYDFLSVFRLWLLSNQTGQVREIQCPTTRETVSFDPSTHKPSILIKQCIVQCLTTHADEHADLFEDVNFFESFTLNDFKPLLNCLTNIELSQYLQHTKPENCPWVVEVDTQCNQRFIHIAAAYGKIVVLDWCETHASELLQEKDNNGDTIAHWAAAYGKIAVLDWCKTHSPELLQEKNNNGFTIAHWAAMYGKIAVLDWCKTHSPELLQEKTNNGLTIAHWAASRGKVEALNWCKQHDETLFLEQNQGGDTPQDLASKQNNEEGKNWFHDHFKHPAKRQRLETHSTLNQASDDNSTAAPLCAPTNLP